MKSLIRTLSFSLVAAGLVGAGHLQATVIFDNITNQSAGDSTSVTSTQTIGQAFKTGEDPFIIKELVFSIGAVSEDMLPTVQIGLWTTGTDQVSVQCNGGAIAITDWPGIMLSATPLLNNGFLYSGAAPSANQDWHLEIDNCPTLAPNTQYWISVGVSGGGFLDWNWAQNGALAITTNNLWDPTGNSSIPSTYYVDYPNMMSVSDAVPEPSSIALSFLGIGALAFLRRFKRH